METLGSTRVRANEISQFHLPALTVEVAVYGLLALTALWIRSLALDAAPLSPSEALQALASWDFVNGRDSATIVSPLLFTLNSILFFLTGAHDASVRVLPALAGCGLVLVPALIRRELGRSGALLASLALTISPTLVFFSRNGNGAIIAVTCAAAALAWGWRYLSHRAPRDLYFTVNAAALGLLAAREVWTVVLAGVMFVALRWRSLRAAGERTDMGDGYFHTVKVLDGKQKFVRAGIVGAAVLVLIGTSFLMHRGGIGAAADLFGNWLRGLVPGGSPFDPLRVLIIYEPMVLFFGIAGCLELASALVRKESSNQPLLMLALWALLAFVLYSIGADKNPARLVALVVPLAVVAGWYVGTLVEQIMDRFRVGNEPPMMLVWQELPVFLFACAISVFLYFVIAEFSVRGSVMAADLVAGLLPRARSPDLNGIVLTGLIASAIAVVGFLAVSSLGWDRAKDVAAAIAMTLLTLWGIRQMALVNYSGGWNPEDWLVSESTSENVRDLVADLEDLSRWRANDSHTLTLLADNGLGPVARWYLRDFRYARYEDHPAMVPGINALLLRPDIPVDSSKLMSQNYRLYSTGASTQPAYEFLQWLLFRQGVGPRFQQAVLWIPQPGE